MNAEPGTAWSWQEFKTNPVLYAGRLIGIGIMISLPFAFLFEDGSVAGDVGFAVGWLLILTGGVLFFYGLFRKFRDGYRTG